MPESGVAATSQRDQHGRTPLEHLCGLDALRGAFRNRWRERLVECVSLPQFVRLARGHFDANVDHTPPGLLENGASAVGVSLTPGATEEVNSVRGQATNAYAELAFHMLACVPCAAGVAPLASAASLHDPTYVEWSDQRGAPTEDIREDSGVASALLADPHTAAAISMLAILHTSLDSFLDNAARPLSELSPTQVSEPGALRQLLEISSPAIEIVRADMALGARSFATFFEGNAKPRIDEVVDRVGHVSHSAASAPALLHTEDWELSLALGVHGRVFGSRVIVGAGHPDEPLDAAAARAHALICHERTVSRASEVLRRRGLPTEWAWVESLAVAVERALLGRGALPRTHAVWLESLSFDGLADLERAIDADLTRETIEAT